jgi:hypothetical protein
MKNIIKFIAWTQTILGGLFSILSLAILVHLAFPLLQLLWRPITNAETGELGMWPIIFIPIAPIFVIALPQFITGFIAIRKNNYSKKIFIPLVFLFIQLFLILSLFSHQSKFTAIFYFWLAVSTFIISLFISIFWNKINEKIFWIIFFITLILIMTGQIFGFGVGIISEDSIGQLIGGGNVINKYSCMGILINWNCFGYSVITRDVGFSLAERDLQYSQGNVIKNLKIGTIKNNAIQFHLLTASEQCSGEINDFFTIDPYLFFYNRSESFLKDKCHLEFIFNDDSVEIKEEGDCSYYHGASCSFIGEYVRNF